MQELMCFIPIFAAKSILMKTILHKVFTVLLALVFQVSTGGILVYIHHCQHQQETYTSLFVEFGEEHPCLQASTPAPTGCCAHETHEIPSACDFSCCQDMSLLLKFVPDSEPSQPGSFKPMPIPSDVPGYLMVVNQSTISDHSKQWDESPPEKPPISGRQLVILHQQMKVDILA